MEIRTIALTNPAPADRISRRSLVVGGGAIAFSASLAKAGSFANGAVDAFLRQEMSHAAIPGLAVGVARHGNILFCQGYGYADVAGRRPVGTDSMFHIASVTKTVTAAGIMMLVRSDRIALDDPINIYLDFPVENPVHPRAPITVRHLMMHMSGISDETYYNVDFRTPGKDTPLPLGDFLRSYLVPGGEHYSSKGSFSQAAPGEAYDYSNVGYGLLGYLGSRVAGEDFRLFLRRRLFDRLGMHHAAWSLADVPRSLRVTPYESDDGKIAPIAPVGFPDWSAGMLRISIGSFMPFVAASANGGASANARMLDTATMAQMLVMHKLAGLPQWLTGQGLGWMESADGGTPHVNHWGGDPGVFTAAYLDPATTTGVAIFTNCSATAASKAAMKRIAARLIDPSGLENG